MKKALERLTETELRNEFIKVCLEQEKADDIFEIAKLNRLYHKMAAVVEELKRRPGDARHCCCRCSSMRAFRCA